MANQSRGERAATLLVEIVTFLDPEVRARVTEAHIAALAERMEGLPAKLHAKVARARAGWLEVVELIEATHDHVRATLPR